MPEQPRSSKRAVIFRANSGKIAIALIAAVSSVAVALINNWTAIFPPTVTTEIEIPQPEPPDRTKPDEEETTENHDPAPPQDESHFELSGAWDFHLTAKSYIDQRGRKRSTRNQAEIRIQLNQKGSEIDGQFLWADVCANAQISGSRKGNKLDFTMHYRGSCCGGSVTKFKGEIISPSAIVGTYEPVSTPTSGCNLWWADVSALKKG